LCHLPETRDFHRIAVLHFDDMAAIQAALPSAEARLRWRMCRCLRG